MAGAAPGHRVEHPGGGIHRPQRQDGVANQEGIAERQGLGAGQPVTGPADPVGRAQVFYDGAVQPQVDASVVTARPRVVEGHRVVGRPAEGDHRGRGGRSTPAGTRAADDRQFNAVNAGGDWGWWPTQPNDRPLRQAAPGQLVGAGQHGRPVVQLDRSAPVGEVKSLDQGGGNLGDRGARIGLQHDRCRRASRRHDDEG